MLQATSLFGNPAHFLSPDPHGDALLLVERAPEIAPVESDAGYRLYVLPEHARYQSWIWLSASGGTRPSLKAPFKELEKGLFFRRISAYHKVVFGSYPTAEQIDSAISDATFHVPPASFWPHMNCVSKKFHRHALRHADLPQSVAAFFSRYQLHWYANPIMEEATE